MPIKDIKNRMLKNTVSLDSLLQRDTDDGSYTIKTSDGTEIRFEGPRAQELAASVIEALYTQLLCDTESSMQMRAEIAAIKQEILETTEQLKKIYDMITAVGQVGAVNGEEERNHH